MQLTKKKQFKQPFLKRSALRPSILVSLKINDIILELDHKFIVLPENNLSMYVIQIKTLNTQYRISIITIKRDPYQGIAMNYVRRVPEVIQS